MCIMLFIYSAEIYNFSKFQDRLIFAATDKKRKANRQVAFILSSLLLTNKEEEE